MTIKVIITMLKRTSLFLTLFCVLGLGAHAMTYLGNCASWSATDRAVQFKCDGGAVAMLQIVTPEMVRVRVSPDGIFPESLTVKLGFVKDDWPVSPFKTREADGAVWIDTGALKIKAAKQPFRLTFCDSRGKSFLKESDAPGMGLGKEGTEIRMEMAPEEHFYGLGFQRKTLDERGAKLNWKRRFRNPEASVGYFMSTRGYGFYTNNTFHHVFDFTEKTGSPNYYSVTSEGGQLDYYIIHGPAFRQILERYTALTGRTWMVPRWALGFYYMYRWLEDEPHALSIAREYPAARHPAGHDGHLAAGRTCPYAMRWNWSPTRFPHPEATIKELAGMGLKKFDVGDRGMRPKRDTSNPEVRERWYATPGSKRPWASASSGSCRTTPTPAC